MSLKFCVDNQSAGRVVKLPSSGDELCLPRDFSTASQNSTRVVEEIVSQHPSNSAALKSEADQGLQIPEEVLNATQIVDSNRHGEDFCVSVELLAQS